MGSLKSMTGYGKAVKSINGYNIKIEMKSVNHRNLELNIKMSRDLISLEMDIRSFISERIARGKVDVYIHVEMEGLKGKDIKFNKELIRYLYDNVQNLCLELGVPQPPLSYFLREAFTIGTTYDEELKSFIMETLEEAVSDFIAFREKEGEKLKRDILTRIENVGKFIEKAESIAEIAINETKAKLMEKLRELNFDEARIMQEVMATLTKIDVNEELVRLRSHVDFFLKTLEEGSPCGKKLDFIAQEMLREANTLGAKIAHAKLSYIAVNLKTEIEKIREQIQNIE
ncbi:MAG: YicC/YloC family endoribonuclease [Thermosulfidibacteraceae bacterium]